MWGHLRRHCRWYLAGSALVAAAAVWLTWAALGADSGVSRWAADRIQLGLSHQEVCRLIGEPPSSYMIETHEGGKELLRTASWRRQPRALTSAANLVIIYGEAGVQGKSFGEDPWLPHVWSQLRQRLGFP